MNAFAAMEEHIVKVAGSGRLPRLSSVKSAKLSISPSGPYLRGPKPVSMAGMEAVRDTEGTRRHLYRNHISEI